MVSKESSGLLQGFYVEWMRGVLVYDNCHSPYGLGEMVRQNIEVEMTTHFGLYMYFMVSGP